MHMDIEKFVAVAVLGKRFSLHYAFGFLSRRIRRLADRCVVRKTHDINRCCTRLLLGTTSVLEVFAELFWETSFSKSPILM